MASTPATLLPVVTGEQIKRARERAGLHQTDVARAVGVSRTTVSNWERGLSSPRNSLGKILEVLGLDQQGRPTGGNVLDTDLRGIPLTDLVALQGRLTAEFARRLGERRQGDPPGWVPTDVVAFPDTAPPEGTDTAVEEPSTGQTTS